ncbi:MAG: 3-oxoacyl-[acyl-carrier protein] reductase [Gammaproteobacteria bacterium]|jgi:3-oxoacyl-[acyl-carrier protein] reductase
MDLGLKDKVALVTAGSRGLGRAIAEELAAEGAAVVISSRSREVLETTAAQIAAQTGGEVSAIAADLMDAADVDALVEKVERTLGPIDILIANSGGPVARPFVDLTDDDWHTALNQKLLAQIRPCRAVLPGMMARGAGRILTMGGVHGYYPAAYAITAGVVNAAVLNLTKALAKTGASRNVLVNSINPGPIRTARITYLCEVRARDEGISVEEAERVFVDDMMLKRLGDPRDVGALAAFMVSERAGFMTGSMVSVDGGMHPTI